MAVNSDSFPICPAGMPAKYLYSLESFVHVDEWGPADWAAEYVRIR